MKDEIIDEVRRIRDDYVAKHHYNLDDIFEDLKKRESTSSRPIEDLAAKRKTQPHGNSASK
jgi:hypothetical protein